jgi:hypothetical protein
LSSGAINSTTKAKDQATVAGKFIQLRQQKSRPSAITANSQIFNGFVLKNGMLA